MSHYSKCMVIKVHFSHFVCVSGVAFLRLTDKKVGTMSVLGRARLKEAYKMAMALGAWPTNPYAHLFAYTYITKISLHVTLSNKSHSTCWDQSFSELVVILPDYALRISLGTFSILLSDMYLCCQYHYLCQISPKTGPLFVWFPVPLWIFCFFRGVR